MICPNGHDSTATDYCDTCGAAMPPEGPTTPATGEPEPPAALADPGSGDAPSRPDAAPVQATPADPGGVDTTKGSDVVCPNCGSANTADALFCEACGYDYTTGSMPRGASTETLAAGEASDPSGGAAPAAATPPGNASRSLSELWVAEVWIDPAWYADQGSPDPLPSPGPPEVVALRNTSLLIGRVSVSRGIHPDIDCGADNGVSRRHAQLTTDGTRWWVEDLESSNGTYVGDTVGELPTSSLSPHRKREIGPDDRLYVGSWTRIVIRRSTHDEVDALAP